ncbi:hypothetical protein PIB30_084734, partial [Stylosanthes scabra]|nr:hypothetical protein [Stylosanthes scabra]
MKGGVGYGFLEIECLRRNWKEILVKSPLNWFLRLKSYLNRGFCERVFKRASEVLENGSFSEGIDSCLGRIDSHDSGLKENVILGLQSRFSIARIDSDFHR